MVERSMAIDDPFDAVQQQYPEGAVDGPFAKLALASSMAAVLGAPVAGPLAAIFSFLDSFSTQAKLDRGLAFIRVLIEEFAGLEQKVTTMKTDMAEIHSALRISITNDVTEFNDAKRSRYIRIATSAVMSETKVQDLVSFIHDVEQLGERDLIGLKVLNRFMNREGDWKDTPPNTHPIQKAKLHPNTFIQRAHELSVQMTHALKDDKTVTDGDQFSREDGLQICLRLQGFGLAQEIPTGAREVPIANYSARPTTRGLMLLRLLGEDIPNWGRYFDENGPL
jgi:hypothetical protein